MQHTAKGRSSSLIWNELAVPINVVLQWPFILLNIPKDTRLPKWASKSTRALRARTPHIPCSLSTCMHHATLDILCCWRPLPTHERPVVCMSRRLLHINSGNGRGVWLWWPTKIHYLWPLQVMPLNSKHSFSPNLTDLLCLRAAKVPKCSDQAIFFLLTTTTTLTEPITLSLAHACGVHVIITVPQRVHTNSGSKYWS